MKVRKMMIDLSKPRLKNVRINSDLLSSRQNTYIKESDTIEDVSLNVFKVIGVGAFNGKDPDRVELYLVTERDFRRLKNGVEYDMAGVVRTVSYLETRSPQKVLGLLESKRRDELTDEEKTIYEEALYKDYDLINKGELDCYYVAYGYFEQRYTKDKYLNFTVSSNKGLDYSINGSKSVCTLNYEKLLSLFSNRSKFTFYRVPRRLISTI